MKKRLSIFIFTFIVVVIVGCNTAEDVPSAQIETQTPTDVPVAEEPLTTSVPPTATAEPIEPTAQGEKLQTDAPTIELEKPNTPKPVPTLHPAEALIQSFTEPPQTNGDLLVLYGQILDTNGDPVPAAVVEIWQTDNNGVYDHPDDPSTNGRDTTFQFFGSASANMEGWYAFRTILPGKYEPRPRHIHFKVKQNGSTLLTSQFYFSDDIAEIEGEGMFRAVGESGDLLVLQLIQNNAGPLLANGRVVLDIDDGELPFTPSQAEGPYYPTANVAGFNNDLTVSP